MVTCCWGWGVGPTHPGLPQGWGSQQQPVSRVVTCQLLDRGGMEG